MLFSSLVFLFVFLPMVLGFYYLSPRKGKNLVLLIFSLLFYAWGGVSYSLILLVSLIVNFLISKRIDLHNQWSKSWLILGLIFNLLLIGVFKYLDFFIENINSLTSFFSIGNYAIPLQEIALPIGISFFTFQQISLLWDVYRSKKKHSASFLDTSLYISFFPQLIAGPIVRFNDIIDQIWERKESINHIYQGIKRFILGLSKKVLLANNCALLADGIMDKNPDELSTSVAWLGIIAYAFQIYFDFSGYSDMAIGLARMFGFRLNENFNFPYISKSIQEFWRRWHISLSTWFRDYVYIPLGGNRKGSARTYYNLMLVFLFTGFWHGATWSFVFWGIFHGLFLIIERTGFSKILNRLPNFFSWLYTVLVVLVGWVFFRIEDFSNALDYNLKLFGFGSTSELSIWPYLNLENIIVLIIALLGSLGVFQMLIDRLKDYQSPIPKRTIQISMDFALMASFILCAIYINSGSYNPFIYFRF